MFLELRLLHRFSLMSEATSHQHLLKVALTTTANQYDFYLKAANAAETPQVKALLMVLAETEGELIERIRLMMTTGILDVVEEVAKESFSYNDPNPTPFGMDRTPFAESNIDTDPVCTCVIALWRKNSLDLRFTNQSVLAPNQS